MTIASELERPTFRLLFLTGIQEELLPLFERHPFVFDRGVAAYRSQRHPDLYAATLGPAVKKKRETRDLIATLAPHVIINAGLVGLLRDQDPRDAGAILKLGQIIDSVTGVIYPGGPGHDCLVTVDRPVFEPWNKQELALHYRAQACDMEAARLLRITGQIEEVSIGTELIFLKVIGDRPESYELFKHEALVRNWHRLNWFGRLRVGLRFPGGPARLRRLLNAKAAALQALGEASATLVDRLITARGDTRGFDSLFIPH